MLATLGNPNAAGEVLNIGEPTVRSIRGWAQEILAAAGHQAELVEVPDAQVPEDLWITKGYGQHIIFDSHKASDILGWRATDPTETVARSVRWHLANPPTDSDCDFSPDDKALAASS